MKYRPLFLLPFLPLLNFQALAADGTWTGTTSGAWFTATNWSSSVIPGSQSVTSNADIAAFGVAAQPTVGINMNFTGNTYYLGAIDYTNSTARNIGNSSGSTAGTLVLNGATVNSVANTIIRNSSTGLLTIQATQGSTMGLALGNSTNNVIQITGTGGITISSIISGSAKKLTLQGGGTGSLTLSGVNTYSGGTSITSGLDSQSAGAINVGNASALGTGDVTFNNTATMTGLYFQSGFGTASTLANNITFTSSGVITRLLATAGISQVVTLSGKLSGGSATSSIRVDNTASSGVARFKLTNATNDVTVSVWEMWRGGLEFTSDAALGNANNGLKLNVGAASDPTGTGLIFGANSITLASTRSLEIASRTNIDTQAFTGSQINGAITFTNTLVKKGSTTLTLNGTGTGTGGIRIDAGTVQVGSGSTTGSIGTGAVAFNASGTKLVLNRSDALSVSGNITGAGSVEKLGAGTTTLSGSASTYSGGTTISGGVISIGAAANIGTGNIAFTTVGTGLTLTGTAITLANNISLPTSGSGNITLLTPNNSATTINGIISGGGTNTVLFFQGGSQGQNTGALTLNGINTFQGTINVQRGPLILGNSSAAGTAIIKLDSNDNPNGALQFSSSFTVSNAVNLFDVGEKIGVATSQTNTLSGVISGSNGFEKVGGGTLVISNTNTYTGTTLVSAGTLQVSGGSAIVDTGTVTTANTSGAVFQLGSNETIGTLNGGGSTGGKVDLQSNNLTVGAGNFAGEISGTAGVIKNTSGTLLLTGTSTYTGTTTVSAGTLQADGALGNTTTTINGGTLSGTGSIAGSVTVNTATLAPGASPGSLELGADLALGANTTTAIEIGGTNFTLNGSEDYDRIKLSNNSAVLTLNGTLSLALVNSFSLAQDQAFGIFQLESGATRTGTFTGLGTDGSLVGNFGGLDLFITYSGNFGDSGTVATFGGNDVVLYTVPEPEAALLGGLGLLALLRRRR